MEKNIENDMETGILQCLGALLAFVCLVAGRLTKSQAHASRGLQPQNARVYGLSEVHTPARQTTHGGCSKGPSKQATVGNTHLPFAGGQVF